MQQTAVIIIGAGAAGLMAARTLAKAGKKVIVLEARNRTGGRIHTLGDASFFKRAELGAEFIHGDLPLTQQLLDEAGIEYVQSGSEMYRYADGRIQKGQEQIDDWDLLMQRLNELTEDTDINSFLERHFAGEQYAALRKSARQFVTGYDSADPKLASAFSLRREWNSEDLEAQYRVPEGYCALIRFLSQECKAAGGEVILSAPVTEINVEPEQVSVITKDNTIYTAEQVLIALPLGVLQAKASENGAIKFGGIQDSLFNTFHQIGFGAIIKVLVLFDKPFWEEPEFGEVVDTGFILSEEEVPTWWNQSPGNPLLTGWLGGPNARAVMNLSDQDIWLKAVSSLSKLFNINAETLKGRAVAWQVANWTADPYTRGSYAYDTVYSAQARKTLSEPVAGRLWFAGEYLYEGAAMGTVEAALQSGLQTAEAVMAGRAVTNHQEVSTN